MTRRQQRRSKARRERISFYEHDVAADAYGTPKRTGTVSAVAGLQNLHAWYEHTGGTESFRGQQLEANVAAVFECRDPQMAISTEYMLEHVNKSKRYEIVSVRPAEEYYEGGFRNVMIFVRAYANG